MNLYKYLKETELLNELKETLTPDLHNIQNIISKYILMYKRETAKDTIDTLQRTMQDVVDKFSSLGYTYQPETVPDVNENIFKNILDKYKEFISKFLGEFSEDLFESFNVQTRYILNLIEVHRTKYIEEGEVLTDE